MSVKIRLRRIGRKKQPSYRVVVIPTTAPRDGAYLDAIGFYNPRRQPRAELRLDLERVDYWVGNGAAMSDTVASLVRKARQGGDDSVELFPLSGPPPGSQSTSAPPESGAQPAPAETAAAAAAAPEPAAPEAPAEPPSAETIAPDSASPEPSAAEASAPEAAEAGASEEAAASADADSGEEAEESAGEEPADK